MNLYKNNLRKQVKNYDKSPCSQSIIENLKKSNFYKNAKNIMIFYPLKNEVNLLSLLNDSSKNFYLPKIKGNTLSSCPYCIGDDLVLSKYNVFEPLTTEVDKSELDLIIVPALCCDKNGYRLGYGGGYYDRFLQNYNGKKVVCLPQNMIFDDIYPEKHDIRMDFIVTD